MAAEAEAKLFSNGAAGGDGDTFLTDLMKDNRKMNSELKRQPSYQSAMKQKSVYRDGDSEMNAEDIEDELRDVVFDYENSKQLILQADDYLTNKKATFKNSLNESSETQSQYSDARSTAS